MRSVPHRVVCLLGLDDGAFPRKAPRDGDDLMLDDPHVGDRDARTEDRQLLLDALLAATDRLVVTYTRQRRAHERARGRRPCRSASCSTSSTRTVRLDDAGRARDARRRPPPAAAVRPAQLRRRAGRPPWSFDRVDARRRRARSTGRAPRAGAVPRRRRCRRAPRRVVELDDLVRFVEHPVRAFLRQRLGVGVGERRRRGRRRAAGRARRASSSGASASGCSRRGSPASTLDAASRPRSRAARCRRACSATPVLDAVCAGRRGDRRRGRRWRCRRGDARRSTSRVALPGRARAQRHGAAACAATCCARSTYSRVGPQHRLAAWVRLLALDRRATRSGRSRRSTIGRARRGGRRRRDRRRAHRARRPSAARSSSSPTLVDLYDRGMREPLPLACRTSAAYAQACRGRRRGAAARGVGAGWNSPQEDAEPEHQLVLGGVRPFAELLAEPPRPDEARLGRPTSRRASARSRAGSGTGCSPSRSDDVSADRRAAPFDVCGPLPTRRHRARGERRHGQDVHDRGARGALRRRGRRRSTQLLLVTFTRMATGELRERVRERLVAAEQGLARGARRRAAPADDGRRGCSPTGTADEVERAARGSPRALADFDAATIATTHGFCQEVLGGLGIAGDVEPDATFVEDLADLSRRSSTTSTCAASTAPTQPAVRPRARRCAIARAAVDNPAAPIEPRRRRPTRSPAMRRRLAEAVARGARARASAALGVMTYDDLLTRLRRRARRRGRRGRGARGCASATASCSSTSSRTPTRCSGRSCGARSATAARRWS